jgi:hypothetical protein
MYMHTSTRRRLGWAIPWGAISQGIDVTAKGVDTGLKIKDLASSSGSGGSKPSSKPASAPPAASYGTEFLANLSTTEKAIGGVAIAGLLVGLMR